MALYQDALRTSSGTPEDCIRFLDLYEALGIEEVILLSPSGRRSTHTLRLFGEHVIPHFRSKEPRVQAAPASA
jgi:hypothetical protein